MASSGKDRGRGQWQSHGPDRGRRQAAISVRRFGWNVSGRSTSPSPWARPRWARPGWPAGRGGRRSRGGGGRRGRGGLSYGRFADGQDHARATFDLAPGRWVLADDHAGLSRVGHGLGLPGHREARGDQGAAGVGFGQARHRRDDHLISRLGHREGDQRALGVRRARGGILLEDGAGLLARRAWSRRATWKPAACRAALAWS